MRSLLACLVLSLLAAACGDDDAAGCVELRESVDQASGLHLIDPSGATWLTDPPTSGPHLSAPTPDGVVAEPLGPAMQVAILEEGGALVQFDDTATADEMNELGVEPLPQSLYEALDVMEQSSLVRDALGEHIFEWFLRNKRSEWRDYKTHVSQWELERYLPSW